MLCCGHSRHSTPEVCQQLHVCRFASAAAGPAGICSKCNSSSSSQQQPAAASSSQQQPAAASSSPASPLVVCSHQHHLCTCTQLCLRTRLTCNSHAVPGALSPHIRLQQPSRDTNSTVSICPKHTTTLNDGVQHAKQQALCRSWQHMHACTKCRQSCTPPRIQS
jgi:hypothetical protein